MIAEAQPEAPAEEATEAQPEGPDPSTPTTGSYRSKCRTGCTASF